MLVLNAGEEGVQAKGLNASYLGGGNQISLLVIVLTYVGPMKRGASHEIINVVKLIKSFYH